MSCGLAMGSMVEKSARLVLALMSGVGDDRWPVLQAMAPVLQDAGLPLLSLLNDTRCTSCAEDPGGAGAGCPGAHVLAHRIGRLRRLLERQRPCGVVAVGGVRTEFDRAVAGLLAEVGVPVVRVGGPAVLTPLPPGESLVRGDDTDAVDRLLLHLLERRPAPCVALLAGRGDRLAGPWRERVLREGLARHGVSLAGDLVWDDGSGTDGAQRWVERLLRRRRDVNTLVALDDGAAVGAVRAVLDAGLRVPEDVAVAAVDSDPGSTRGWGEITSVDQDLRSQGALAASLLLDRMRGRGGPRERPVPSRLLLRWSTAGAGHGAPDALEAAVRSARDARDRVLDQHLELRTNRTMLQCRTIEQMAQTLVGYVRGRLDVHRCFLVLYGLSSGEGMSQALDGDDARLVMAYRDGDSRLPVCDPFPRTALLPPELRYELDGGTLVCQPLTAGSVEVGHLLVEQGSRAVGARDVLRLDLGRAVAAVLHRQDERARVARLERLVASRTAELAAVRSRLRRSITCDGLTGIPNRVAFGNDLLRCWTDLSDQGGEASVLLIDVDRFSAFNDRYGHLVGDEALRGVAGCLSAGVRDPWDIVYRYGGASFAALLPRSGVLAALAVAERFRGALADAAIPHEASGISRVVTVSIGIGVDVVSSERAPAEVVRSAEVALSRAQREGRDRVAVEGGAASMIGLPVGATPGMRVVGY